MPFLVYRGSRILGRPVGTPKNSSNFKKKFTLHYLPQNEPQTTEGGHIFQNSLIISHPIMFNVGCYIFSFSENVKNAT